MIIVGMLASVLLMFLNNAISKEPGWASVLCIS